MSDTPKKKPDEFYLQSMMLAEVIKRILDKKASINLSRVVDFNLKPIIEFKKRMRVSGIEKFDGVTYISVIYYFLSEEDREEGKPVGTLVVYVEDEYLEELFRKLEYPRINIDDQEAVEDACGTFCNLVAGNFKSGLTQLGYQELIMTPFESYRTEVINGVPYDTSLKNKYEIVFEIGNHKRIIAELIMGKIPKVSEYEM